LSDGGCRHRVKAVTDGGRCYERWRLPWKVEVVSVEVVGMAVFSVKVVSVEVVSVEVVR
jgi:hypothetical protein